MLDNSIVSFISKTPYKCLLYTGTAGLIAFQHPYIKSQSLKLLDKAQPIREKLTKYYSFLIEVNQNLWLKVKFYIHEHPTIVQNTIAVISIASATALIYRNRGEVKTLPISLIHFTRNNLESLRYKLK